MTTLKPYPSYRDLGIDLLCEVPAHWEVRRSKYVFREIDQRASGNSLPRLSISQRYGLVPNTEIESWRLQSESAVGAKIAHRNDLVLNRLKAHLAVFSHAPVRGTVSPDYTVLRPSPDINVRYYESLYRTPIYKAEFFRRTKGITEGFWRLYTDDFYDVPVPCPPLPEQDAIADFINAMDARITRFIAARKKMIRLLEEKKQAVINQAVTRGLDPSVPMKDSGVDWLGDIPAHWEYAAIGRYWRVTDCKHVTVPFVTPAEDTYPLASVVQAQQFDLDLSAAKYTTADWYRFLIEGGRKPRQGDLIFCRNVSVGSAAYVRNDTGFAMGQDVCLLSSSTHDSRFLNYCLSGGPLRRSIDMLLVGSTFRRINVAEIRSLKLPLPPLEEEQQAIVKYLDSETSRIEKVVNRSQHEIELIQEYRTRLVSDVVTGKLDVRGVDLGELPEFDAIPQPDDPAEDISNEQVIESIA